LAVQTDPAFETIVVDNGSEDDSVDVVATEFPEVRLLPTGENLGFAEGCNRGIEIARGVWIALLNNDTQADPDWLLRLREQAIALPPDVGMLQSKLLLRNKPTHLNSTGLLLFDNATARDRGFDEPDPEQSAAEEIFAPTAGAALYRRAMLEAVRQSTGYLDRGFFMYFEDVDLGWRCRLAGWRAFYVPSSFVLHAFQNSTKRKPGDFLGWHTRKNRLRSLVKNASLQFFVACLPKTISDLVWILRWRGWADAREAIRLAWRGLELRQESESLRIVARRSIERSWVTRR
jgi:GT2 family glycosyltransferase